ncbi:MAG: hypothetical protein PWR24_1688 [Desulfonauticus sp.]|jgi:hypothetical protein|nr:MAG: hypothetical protein XD41_1291 [Desulfonauticus sp. 38_4375]MDK2922131.1 hypothetical protein [Desulfonauticus sp.]
MSRKVKKDILRLLEQSDSQEVEKVLRPFPPEKVLPGLFAGLLSTKEKVKWNAVVGFGAVVDSLAAESLEKARIVMRRFMWMLNDESGGIGWGVPESMGEIMAVNPHLATEYHQILISYLREEENEKDNFLEYAPLRRGAFWGIARLAQGNELLAKKAWPKVKKTFREELDPYILAYSLLYAKEIGLHIPRKFPFPLGFKVHIFWNRQFWDISFGELIDFKL